MGQSPGQHVALDGLRARREKCSSKIFKLIFLKSCTVKQSLNLVIPPEASPSFIGTTSRPTTPQVPLGKN